MLPAAIARRVLPRTLIPTRRTLATVAAEASNAEASDAAAATRYKLPALGVNPAYDEALKVIAADRAVRLERLKAVEQEIARAVKATKSLTQAEQLSALRKLKLDLQVKAELNDPEVRWNFKHGYSMDCNTQKICSPARLFTTFTYLLFGNQLLTLPYSYQSSNFLPPVDMSYPVYRYLAQKHFQKEVLTRLMQRITQMYVIPDLLPSSFVPSVNLKIDIKQEIGVIEPGVFVKPSKTIQPPALTLTNFHEDTRLYTVLMVDPGGLAVRSHVPDPENMTYQQTCHWLMYENAPVSRLSFLCSWNFLSRASLPLGLPFRTNVPLSTTSPTIVGGDIILPYVPPHPQRGTKYHRYTIIAFEQPEEGKKRVQAVAEKRTQFDTASFRKQYDLTPKGVTFFRGVWDESVSRIYKKILHVREPVYGNPPRIDPYITETGYKQKKYLNI
ncbi:phosphatidylethanolamine-binding protein [Endogone sp. FLAS-F59071]|nr:phosphatidylethanolamine-binding protein [Endogone sp. FLAS-F59071]|eukprot:RUS15326.1 phosphatidylethanolamine-binding protein [Endogone sp. FLAS-F59071]